MIEIHWTAVNPREAETICRLLLEKKLVACAQILPGITSLFHWEGKLQKETETKVLLKTIDEHFPEIEALIKREASYDVPEILCLEVSRASQDYFSWLKTQVVDS